MARETKAQRMEREAAEQAAQEATQRANYHTMLMTALESATQENNYELEVRAGMFKLRDRDSSDGWREATLLTLSYNQESWEALEDLNFRLQLKAEARAEAERKLEAKKAALAKLTQEEKQLLGLY